MSHKIDIDQKVAEIKNPLQSERKWGIAKRDNITFRGSKIKARQFVRIVQNSLPKLTKIDTGKHLDHRENLIKAYCNAGLTGMTKYEKLIWGVFKASSFTQDLKKLSVRTQNIVRKCFEISDINSIDLNTFSQKSLEQIMETKGAGAKTKEEIVELRGKYIS
jgi:hypothetical protein